MREYYKAEPCRGTPLYYTNCSEKRNKFKLKGATHTGPGPGNLSVEMKEMRGMQGPDQATETKLQREALKQHTHSRSLEDVPQRRT